MTFRHVLPGLFALLLAAAVMAAPADRIISGYAGARLYEDAEPWRDYVRLCAESGFNTLDLKLTPNDFDMKDPANLARIEAMAAAAQSAGLRLYFYLYSGDNGKRNPAKPAAAAFMGPDGVICPDKYCFFQPQTWLQQYERLFFLAELSKRMPIAGVKMDLEFITNTTPCVCDDCFGSYATARAQGARPAPAARWTWVGEQGGAAAYMEHLERRLNECAKTVEQKAHALNPDLSLGYMPFADDFFHRPFTKFLASARAPAIIDSWPMYSGLGFSPEVSRECALVKTMNSQNRYVPWLRINTYRPENLATEAFHAGAETDGYNLWTLSMIHPSVKGKPQPELYALPPEYPDPQQYWTALQQGNQRLRGWLENPQPLSHQPLRPLIRQVVLKDFQPPSLLPVVSTSPASGGESVIMRGRNRLYLYLNDPARQLAVDLKHEAGTQRPHGLSYGVVDTRGTEIVRDTVEMGQTAQVRLESGKPLLFGLLIEASSGYQPWYSIKVPDSHYVIDTTGKAYFFRVMPRQYFQVPAGCASFRVHAATRDQAEQARLRVWTPDGQVALDEVLCLQSGLDRTFTFEVPADQQGQAWSLQLSAPEPLPDGCFSENYWIELLDLPPYLSGRPETLLQPGG